MKKTGYLTTKTIKNKHGYKGYLVYKYQDKTIWSEPTECSYENKLYAIEKANSMLNDFLAINLL